MSVIDPTGKLVTTIRGNAAVAAITPLVTGTEKASTWAPPYAIVVLLAASPGLPGGAGRRGGVASWRHAVRCYGPKAPGGDREAERLALTVWDAIDRAGPITFPAPGNPDARAGIYQILAEGMSGPLQDPKTGEPYVVVTTFMAAALHSFT